MTREVPESMQNIYDRTQAGTASPRQAIKMFCLECVGYDREEVKVCSDQGCPLYQYRSGKVMVKRPRSEAQMKSDALNAVRLRLQRPQKV